MRVFVSIVCLALSVGLAIADDQPPEPWLDAPSFEVSPTVLLASAYAHPFEQGAGAVLLLHESTIELDERHRRVFRTRRVFRLLTPDGVRDWSNVSLAYSPWHQERPLVRARVITPDGVSHELDPGTLAESPFGTQMPNVYSDQRLLAGPLPAVSVGSVVEVEIEERDKEPLFDAGVARWIPLQYMFPVRKLRVVLDAPNSLPLRHAVRGLPGVDAVRSVEDDRTRLVLELGPIDPLEDPELFVPFAETAVPYLSWSTGESWAAVARRYSEIVEERLEGSNVGKLVKKALKGAETPAEKITALVSKLHEEIRYTGVQFGQSGIVPAAPATTLERKFGDCKDTATLLVAMLRSAGLGADVALVDSGIEPDLDAEMPGLGFFDHAIVHVSDPEMWIDPTTPHARPGVLTMGVEDRIALIAAPDTAATTRTPALTSRENRSVETREVFLAERGGARIVETTEPSGLQEINNRDWYASAEVEDQRKDLKAYVESFFASDRDFRFEISEPTDLGRPFRLELEIENSEVAYAGPEQAVVSIPVFVMASSLLEYLPPPGDTDDDDDDSRRQADFRVPWPYLLEWHYRIHPAPGFAAAPLPPEDEIRMGPVTLTRHFSLEDDGSVNALLSFDTGKRRWTPAEFEQVWDGLENLEQESVTFLSFEQLGRKHLASGNVRQALDEFRRLAALHPDEALHRSENAEALMAAGLGEAARVEARRAVELEPEDDDAHRTLGWVLLHDPIGRFLDRGCDPTAAESAFRKARELDPADLENRAYLAYLLGLDLRFLPEGHGPRFEEAIAEYRSMREDLDDHSYDLSLAHALLQAARFDELHDLVTELPRSMERDSLWVAAAAAMDGVDAALARAWNLASAPEQRHELISQAVAWLIGNRLYAQASRLISEGLPKDPSAPRLAYMVDLLLKVKKHEELKLEQDGPVAFLKREIIEMFEMRGRTTGFSKSLAEVYEEFPDEVDKVGKLFRFQIKMMQSQWESMGAQALDVGVDTFLAMAEWTIDGDAENGYRCRAKLSMPGEERQFTYFVVVENEKHRVLGAESNFWVLGLEALRRLEAGKAAAARRLIDWIHDARPEVRSEDPLAVPAFLLFWDAEPSDDHDLSAAAAAVVAGSPGSKTVLPILEQGRESADEAERPSFDLALVAAYGQLERWEDALAAARRLRVVHPDSARGFGLEAGALYQLKRWEELARIANERLEAKKDDPTALQMLASAASEQNRRDETETLLKRIIDSGKAGPLEYNNLAWNRLELGQVDAETVNFAERAALYPETPSTAALHTLAAVYAEAGRFTEARELALRLMMMRGAEQPGSLEWHVFGRIAEGYGEREAAILYYGRVSESEGKDDDCKPCYRIARQRLKALESP